MASTTQILATVTEQAADKLVKNIQAMPAEKITWKPMDNGRSVVDQVVECALLNAMSAANLRDLTFPPFDYAKWQETQQRATAENATPEKLIALLQKGTSELVAAIRSFPEDKLSETVSLPFGPDMVKPWYEVIMFTYGNMTYHEGQICYIQTLYGDKDHHAF